MVTIFRAQLELAFIVHFSSSFSGKHRDPITSWCLGTFEIVLGPSVDEAHAMQDMALVATGPD